MILDVLFYVTMYMSLFVSIFWLSVYYTKKEIQRPFKHVPLTMIIPTYNKAKTVGKTIRSLENQNYKKLKIIVIDDGSTDNTKSVVKKLMKLYKNITYFKKSNTGKASSLNFGLRKVTTPYFGFIDSDTYISKNVLKKMMSYFDKNIACVTAAIRPSKAENILEKIQKIEYAISTLTRKLMSAINSLYYTPAFALYKTSVIRNIGGFDENNMTEDLEIGFRLKSRGYDIYNSMDSVAYTEIPESFSKLFTQRMRWYRGHIQNTAKYSKSLMGRNFWDMGIVVIMFLYILLPLTSAMFLYGVYNFLISAGKGIIDISLIGIDFNYLSNTFVFNAITPTTFFITSLMIFFAAILKISENNIEGKINRLEYPFYVIFYSFLNIFLWGNAFFQEIIGKKSKW